MDQLVTRCVEAKNAEREQPCDASQRLIIVEEISIWVLRLNSFQMISDKKRKKDLWIKGTQVLTALTGSKSALFVVSHGIVKPEISVKNSPSPSSLSYGVTPRLPVPPDGSPSTHLQPGRAHFKLISATHSREASPSFKVSAQMKIPFFTSWTPM